MERRELKRAGFLVRVPAEPSAQRVDRPPPPQPPPYRVGDLIVSPQMKETPMQKQMKDPPTRPDVQVPKPLSPPPPPSCQHTVSAPQAAHRAHLVYCTVRQDASG